MNFLPFQCNYTCFLLFDIGDSMLVDAYLFKLATSAKHPQPRDQSRHDDSENYAPGCGILCSSKLPLQGVHLCGPDLDVPLALTCLYHLWRQYLFSRNYTLINKYVILGSEL
jgi:hypothetical protein